MPSATVLTVDDDQGIRDLVSEVLRDAGFEVISAQDGAEGLRLFFQMRPHLLIADIMMPKMDGFTLLQRVRELSATPVIMLSALGAEEEKVRALRGGADDYMVKPFGAMELVARVEAALRRVSSEQGEPASEYRDAQLVVDWARHQVQVGGQEVHLSPTEFRLLGALVRSRGRVLTTEQLLDAAWGMGEGGPENLRVAIGYLRRKVEADVSHPQFIETVRGFGYRYSPPKGEGSQHPEP
ncbi:MAG: response regulator transcription factor [Chloroflexi bacterium]|nr:response regulator transcription factor [Chloroflexota bacterium]